MDQRWGLEKSLEFGPIQKGLGVEGGLLGLELGPGRAWGVDWEWEVKSQLCRELRWGGKGVRTLRPA